jgi:UDP-N-acetyl-D-glucosamine dehydrogenase
LANNLTTRIADRSATVAVVGLGYVGLPLAVATANAGFRTIGIDINGKRVNATNQGTSEIKDVADDTLTRLVAEGALTASTDFASLREADAILICVPTPLNKTKDPDLTYVVSALNEIKLHLKPDQLVVLESTTYPGFTREVCLPMLEESGFTCGADFYLAYSPERTDPGNAVYQVHNTVKVLGGMSAECSAKAKSLYEGFIEEVHVVSSSDAAEMAKLLENTFRAVNIGLVNEFALWCNTLGLDTWEVIEAASTKPFGFMPFYPGPGLGGHCLPVDPLYLSWKLRSHNYTARFIELAQTVNASMPRFVVDLALNVLNDQCKPLKGSRVVVFGVAYKRDVDDVRESPALEIIELLEQKGAHVAYVDPYVPSVDIQGRTHHAVHFDAALNNIDLAIITTAHTSIAWNEVVARSPLVLDTRNATGGLDLTPQQRERVVRL